jgi:hypothetical protein
VSPLDVTVILVDRLLAATAEQTTTAFDLASLLPLALSAGGGAFVIALINGLKDLRSGVAAGRRETMQDLMEWRDDADTKRRAAQADADWYRDVSARRAAQLWKAGIVPECIDQQPPSAQVPQQPAVSRRRQNRRGRGSPPDQE